MRAVALSPCLGLIAVALAAIPANAARDWSAIVAAADQEGEVDVHGGPGELYAAILTQGFRKSYPQIKLNFSGASGRDAIVQIMREREAGAYHWDVYIGGSAVMLQTLKPAGAFAPLRPALMLPEVLDDKDWYGGLDQAWMDKERTYVLGFEAMVTPSVVVNWDFVSRDDLKTYQDLQKPEFAGKIVWDDPRLPGPGVAAGQRMLINFGADFLKRLYAGQKIAYIANMRQNAEWVVRGKYPIGIATATEQIVPFQEQGLGKTVAELDVPLDHPSLSAGFGTVAMMDRAPHPNAAVVYINWLLGKSAQTDWGRSGHNSRRLDVPHPDPAAFPVAGVTYIEDQSEENIPSREAASDLARKYIPAAPP
jgi:iron(III) transport system substrate-binding protein